MYIYIHTHIAQKDLQTGRGPARVCAHMYRRAGCVAVPQVLYNINTVTHHCLVITAFVYFSSIYYDVKRSSSPRAVWCLLLCVCAHLDW